MKQKITLSLISVLLLCLMLPGFIFAAKWPSIVDEKVAEVKKSIKTIDMAAFKTVLDKKEFDMLIDVREPNEYAAGHVPGAINIPRGVIEFKIWKKIGFPDKTDTGKKIILYCSLGGRCALAAKSLQDLGFTDVTAVDMKIKEWIKAGNPIER